MPANSGTTSSNMHTSSSFASSWANSSPSRQSPARRDARTTPIRDFNRRSTLDGDLLESPAHKIILELSQIMLKSTQDFNERLDQDTEEDARKHAELLAKAAHKHDRIRHSASLECERIQLELELEQRRVEEAQRKEVERLQQERLRKEAEARQRELEAKRREEIAAREAAEHQIRLQEAEKRVRAEQLAHQNVVEQHERIRAAIEAKNAQEKAAAAAAAAPKPQLQVPQTVAPVAAPVTTTTPAINRAVTQSVPTRSVNTQPVSADVEELHSKYLSLHKRMKEFWKPFKAACAVKGNPLKAIVGDMRRDMRKAMGQITVKREDSRNVIRKIREIISTARQAGGPTIDIRPFFVSQNVPAISNPAEAQYPCVLLYAYICFEKFAIKQFEQEASNDDGRIIIELGAIVASLFIDKQFLWRDVPMIDIIIAKFHRVCPILFGIRGNMNTPEGQARLGWIPISGASPILNTYNQRMLGLGAGYAALTLRHVPQPAIPISECWRAIASICNTPANSIYGGHIMVLKGLVKDQAKKFATLYGKPGVALLRQATVVVPDRASPRVSDTASLLKVLPTVWKQQGLLVG